MQKTFIFEKYFAFIFGIIRLFFETFEFKNLKKEADDAKNKGEIIAQKSTFLCIAKYPQ